MSKTAPSKPKRFPLLMYRRYHELHRGVSWLLIALGIALVVTAVLMYLIRPRGLGGDPAWLLWPGVVFVTFGLARYMLTWAISRVAYVQCTPRNVKIQTPFMPVVFSYSRVIGTRPTNLSDVFSPKKQKGARRAMLEDLWGETVIVVDLKGYPVSRQLLRLIMPYLLTPSGAGFVLLVKDWMALNRQIAVYQERWRERTSKRASPVQQRY